MGLRKASAARSGAVGAACALLALLAPASASAWGFTAHRMINRRAVATLPDPLRRVFENNLDYVTERAIEPDLQRSSSSDPDHFVDMDAFGPYPFEGISKVESENLARFGKESAAWGRLPWRLQEDYAQLVDAFRRRDTPAVLARAAALAHIVSDAHVPLHAALNHDGQLTGQRGVHSRWESGLVERNASQLQAEMLPAAARRIDDRVGFALQTLRDSYLHSLDLLASDRQAAGPRDYADTPEDDRYDDAYFSRFFQREESRLVARLSASASAAGSLWLSAWEDAGRPALDESYRVPYVRHAARVVLLSLDGSGQGLLDDAVARGVMPNLAALRARGSVASGVLSTMPAKTAAAHAALYTGSWSDRNGVADNDLVFPGAPLSELSDGFTSVALQAEPLWAAAARQDLDAVTVSTTQSWPFSTYFDEHRFPGYYGRHLTLIDGYQNTEAADRVYAAADLHPRPVGTWLGPLPAHEGEIREVEIEDLGVTIDGLLYDDPADPAHGFDTLYLGLDRDPKGGLALKPAPLRDDASAFGALSVPMSGGEAGLQFRLFALSPDGTDLTLYRAAAHVVRSNKTRIEPVALEATGGFVGNGAERAYRAGRLGPSLWNGGDGTAERRYLETVALAIRQMERLDLFALDRLPWDILFAYLPYPDEALHAWYGHLDPTLPGHDLALAARLQPYLDRVLRLVDDHVGRLAARLGDRTILAVAGDHGVMGVDHVVRPNAALAKAGLLVLDADGRVDYARTRAVYWPGNSILINHAARPGGIVAAGDVAAVRRKATEALLAIRDPKTGARVIKAVREPGRAGDEPAFGGPSGGDLYLTVAPGYFVVRQLKGPEVEAVSPTGEHFLDPELPAMHSAFVIAGPGVAEGVRLGPIREIDVAPTLAALLGIEPPAQATGAVLEGALARKAPRPPTR